MPWLMAPLLGAVLLLLTSCVDPPRPVVALCPSQGVMTSCRAEGERCLVSAECAEGLGCNQGELPEDLGVGLCRPPAADGAPCGFNHAPADTLGRALGPEFAGIDRQDCAAGLSCAPIFPPPGGTEAPPICQDLKGVPCFFAGACRPDATLLLGAPCARSPACESGVCAVFEDPLSVVPLPGFDASGKWIGPHVGRCVAPGGAISACRRGLACARSFT